MANAFVQKNNATGNLQFADLTCAYSSNVTANNLLVAVVFFNFAGTTLTLSDTQTNTWSAAGASAESTDFVRAKMFYAIASTSGSCTVKIATTGVNSSTIELVVFEYSGLSTTGQPDATAQSTAVDGNDAITTVTDHALIVAAACANAAYPGVGTGYTNRHHSAQFFADVNDKTDATPAGSFTGEFAASQSGNSTIAKVAASFKTSGGAAATAKRLLTLSVG